MRVFMTIPPLVVGAEMPSYMQKDGRISNAEMMVALMWVPLAKKPD